MRVYMETYGCTANLGDSKRIEAALALGGHEVVGDLEDADCIIINTCVIIERTERNMLKRIETLKKSGKRLIVAGCLPAVREVDAETTVVPTNLGKIRKLFDLSCEVEKVCPSSAGVTGILPISEGCVGECAYCIAKKARGALVSYPVETLVRIAKTYIERGVKEIQLTSQDTAAYGIDTGIRLPELIRAITSIDGDFQLRIGMMNPAAALGIADELADAFASEKVFKFLHLPVQSGSDRILGLMKRGYGVSDFRHVLETFKSRFPDMTLSTDFIVGFPTETDRDFEASLELLNEIKSTKVNIKRFSRREGTHAYDMPDILERVKKERSRALSEASRRISLAVHRSWIGRSVEVMVTKEGNSSFTDYRYPIALDGSEDESAGYKDSGAYGKGVRAHESIIARDGTYKNIVIRIDTAPMMLGSKHMILITGARENYLIGKFQ